MMMLSLWPLLLTDILMVLVVSTAARILMTILFIRAVLEVSLAIVLSKMRTLRVLTAWLLVRGSCAFSSVVARAYVVIVPVAAEKGQRLCEQLTTDHG